MNLFRRFFTIFGLDAGLTIFAGHKTTNDQFRRTNFDEEFCNFTRAHEKNTNRICFFVNLTIQLKRYLAEKPHDWQEKEGSYQIILDALPSLQESQRKGRPLSRNASWVTTVHPLPRD